MPTLHLTCFGAFRATLDGKSLAGFETDKARALLVYLAVESDRPHRRQRLAGLLWSDQPEEKALHSLRQTLSGLRKTLGDDRAAGDIPPFLIINRDSVQFDPSCDHWLDVRAFDISLGAALKFRQRANTGRPDIRSLQHAAALYRGQFLDQFYLSGSALFDEWASLQREDYNRQAMEAVALLAEYHEQRGEYGLARQAAARLAEMAPWEETAHAQIMRCLALDGQMSAAQNQYHTLRRYLAQELGVEPAMETISLFEAIRSGQVQPRFPLAEHNLPPSPTPFIGRETELDNLSGMLADPDCRLLTLLGAGGIGKTRLALEAARDQVGLAPHGVYFVPLGAIPSAEFLIPALAEALGLKFFGASDPKPPLFNFLRDKELLLVLDSFEHLLPSTSPIRDFSDGRGREGVDAAAGVDFIVSLLQQAPGVKLLVTSRSPLDLRAECVLEVVGLSYPSDENAPPGQPYSAIALFDQSARRVKPRFSLDAEMPAVVRICQLLEGTPLAIELSAAWVRTQACTDISGQIEQDIGSLATTMRDVPERHRSLRAVFAHSWGLLDENEKRVLRRLSVFRGGFSAEAAAQAAGATPELLKSLGDKSLLRQAASGRYDLHGLVRQFAAEMLAKDPLEEAQTFNLHCRYFAASLHRRADALHGQGQLAALSEIAAEIENVRAGWQWSVAQRQLDNIGQSMTALGRFYEMRSWFHEGRDAFGIAAEALKTMDNATRLYGLSLAWQAWFEMRVGNIETSKDIAGRGLAILRQAGAPADVVFALNILGSAISESGDFAGAKGYFEESLALGDAADDPSEKAFAMIYLGHACRMAGDFEPARKFFEDSLALSTRLGDQWGISKNLSNLAMMAAMAGELAQAAPYFEQSLTIYRTIGDRAGIARCLHNLSNVAYLGSDFPRAKALRLECLDICREIGLQWGVASTLKHLGDVEKSLGDLVAARRRYEESLTVVERLKSAELRLSVLNSLGNLLTIQKELDSAKHCFREALGIAIEIQSIPVAVDVLAGIGEVLLEAGDSERAGRLLAFAACFPNSDQQTKDKAEGLIQRLTGRLSPEAVAKLRDQIQAETFETIVELAR